MAIIYSDNNGYTINGSICHDNQIQNQLAYYQDSQTRGLCPPSLTVATFDRQRTWWTSRKPSSVCKRSLRGGGRASCAWWTVEEQPGHMHYNLYLAIQLFCFFNGITVIYLPKKFITNLLINFLFTGTTQVCSNPFYTFWKQGRLTLQWVHYFLHNPWQYANLNLIVMTNEDINCRLAVWSISDTSLGGHG